MADDVQRRMGDPTAEFAEVKDALEKQIAQTFPIRDKSGKFEVRVRNLSTVDTREVDDIKEQQRRRVTGRSWAVDVNGVVDVVDTATGQVLASRKQKITEIPKMTRHHSWIIDGQEMSLMKQWRLRPGAYVKAMEKPGEFEAQFQLAKGRSFDIQQEERGNLYMRVGGRKIPLYSVLKAAGVSDEAMKGAWGDAAYDATLKKAKPKDLGSFYEAWKGEAPGVHTNLATAIPELLAQTQLDPEIAKLNLGVHSASVNGAMLLAASKKLIAVSGGTAQPDAIDSLRYKELWSAKDHMVERLQRSSGEITQKVQAAFRRPTVVNKLLQGDTSALRDVMPPDLLRKPMLYPFTSTSLSSVSKQTNPLSMLADNSATTIMGPGGIRSGFQLNQSNTAIDPSHLGFLDPVFTPESSPGVTTHLAFGVKPTSDRRPVQRLYNVRTGKIEDVDAAVAGSKVVALPDQVTWKGGKPAPRVARFRSIDGHGEMRDDLKWGQVDYVMPAASQVFALETNLVPFMGNDSAGRTTMSARHMAQAISVVGREAPMVRVEARPGQSFEELIGGNFLAHKTPAAGRVTRVTKNDITVQDAAGKAHTVALYNHYPTNEVKGMLHSTPLVRVGQHVKAGQLLADNNYTKQGILALGTNLRTAYLANGYNHEDGIVISESAAKKLGSEHLYKPSLFSADNTVVGKKAFLDRKPGAYTPERVSKIGDNGLIQVGARVKPGDPLVLAINQVKAPKGIAGDSYERLGKKLRVPFTNSSLTWDSNYEGEVVDVHQNGRNIVVHVKTLEPAQIGSKLSTRHSAKGIVAQILADHEMPHNEKGQHMEMLLNPLGLPGRQNPGQILETVAGRIAEKTKQPYVVRNFQGGVNYLAKLQGELKKHGLKDTDTLYDPKTGRRLGEVTAGPHYTFQLEHQIDKKTHVRSGGPPMTQFEGPKFPYDADTKIPRGGGHQGAQSLGSLGLGAALASNLHDNLVEMGTLKSDEAQAREVWAALTNGRLLPPPKVPFVYNKFEALLRGMGVNLEKTGSSLRLIPRSDAETRALSRGAITRPTMGLRGKDDAPMKAGLFDPTITGGPGAAGQHWGHIELADSLPHPVYAKPIAQALGIKEVDIPEILAGKKDLAGKVGPQAFQDALKKVSVDAEMKRLSGVLADPKVRGEQLQHANSQYKAFKLLKEYGKKPIDAWMIKAVPVLPPVYRPAATLPDGTFRSSPLNKLYQRLGAVNEALAQGTQVGVPWDASLSTRAGLYQEMQNLFGTTPKGKKALDLDMRGTKENRDKKLPGIIHMIAGETPKDGFFQSKLIGKKQDYTARATIVGDPTLSADELGVPRKIAIELMRPMVAQRLIRMGKTLDVANRMISRRDPVALAALAEEVKHRPVLMKRDPVLHQYGLVGQNIKLIDSEAIKVSPLVLPPIGGDVDGDSCWGFVYLRVLRPPESLVTSAWTTLSPSEAWAPDMEALKMAFAASSSVMVGGNGQWVAVDLQNFPRVGEGVTNSRGNTEYAVPEWVEVYALGAAPNDVVQPYRVSHFSVHPNLDMVRVMFTSGRCVEVSSDHSLYCMDPDTLELRKTAPVEALQRLSPRPRRLHVRETLDRIPVRAMGPHHWRTSDKRLALDAPVNADLGYALGAVVGDGWADERGVHCCNGHEAAHSERVATGLRLLVPDLHQNTAYSGYAKDRGSDAAKLTYCCNALGRLVAGWVGQGAANKHLPPFFQCAPEDFRFGLLAGLLDTDGGLSRDKNGRFTINYTTASRVLAEEVQLLATSLGLRTSANNYTRSRGDQNSTYYYVTFWSQDIAAAARERRLQLLVPRKQTVLDALAEKEWAPSATLAKQDLVPLSMPLLEHVKKLGPKVLGQPLYSALHDQLANHPTYTSRYLAKRVIEAQRERVLSHPHGCAWIAIVENEDIVWDRVDALDRIPGKHEAYDLTVPGPYTFMLSSQVIVWDTVSLFVPLGQKSIQEIHRITPSQRTISDSSGDVMYTPQNEAALALYRSTLNRTKSNLTFGSKEEAEKAFISNRIDLGSVISVKSVGPTTLGRLRIAQVVPDKYKRDILTNVDKPFDRAYQASLLKEVALHEPKQFLPLADNLSRLGFQLAYDSGHTVALKDLQPLEKQRAAILRQAQKRVDASPAGAQATWMGATKQLHEAYAEHYAKNPTNISDMRDSGIKAKQEQFQGLVMAPMLVENHRGQPGKVPITTSFAEGIDVGGYFVQAGGARRGVIQKVESVQKPGYMSKLLVRASIDQPITSTDCGTAHGISLSVKNKDTVDRYLAAPLTLGKTTHAAGAVVTPEMIAQAKKEGVDKFVVRSPLKCRMPQGVCSVCMGLHPTGKHWEVGENAGLIAAQALGERAAQLMLKQTHGGGIVSLDKHTVRDFEDVRDLFNAVKPSRQDAAVAPRDGKVLKVERMLQGVHAIHLDNRKTLYTRQKPLPSIVAGASVRRGELLTEGHANLHDVLATQGHEAAQNQMTDRIAKIYGREGILRRHTELAVRNAMGVVEVTDAGGHGAVLRGDTMMRNAVDAMNRSAPGQKPIEYQSMLTPLKSVSIKTQPDFMARLGAENVSSSMLRAAQRGDTARFDGLHPLPALAHGPAYQAKRVR
jgi:DNA-directed RNA polymerase beta subunit/DNA-directed RNA polymerase beta' subunit/intein/homing endonuclease